MAVTIKEVAKLAGTSAAAVSATLSGRSSNIRVGEATKERIYQAAAELGYLSNPVARSLATGKTKVIGLLLPYVEAFTDHDPFCAQVTNGVLEEAVRRHYNVMLYTGGTGAAIDSRVDGVVFVVPPEDSPGFVRCAKRHIKYVSVLREPSPDTLTVNADEFAGGHMATTHLLHLGHRRIAHLTGAPNVCTSHARLEGYKKALADAGIPSYDPYIRTAGFNWEAGYREMNRLLELPASDRPTAVFAANDLCAEGAIRAIREAGLGVPEDVALVGYDDTWFATMTNPPLTSVRMPIAELGQTAVRLLIECMEGRPVAEPHPILPVSLTVRASCGAPSERRDDSSRISLSLSQ